MGWASAGSIADSIWRFIEKYIPEEDKARVAIEICTEFQSQDWDTEHESDIYYVALRDPAYFASEHHWIDSEDDLDEELENLEIPEERWPDYKAAWRSEKAG